MSGAHRYCSQCGHEFDVNQWNEANFCSQCGEELRSPPAPQDQPPQIIEEVYTPQRIIPYPTSEIRTWQGSVVAGCQFAKDNPALSAVAAVGVGAAGLLLGPVIIAAGKVGMIAGGVAMAAGMLIDSDSTFKENQLMKAGAKLVGGSVIVTGTGYLITAVGGVTLATGISVGAAQAVKGVRNAIKARREAKALLGAGIKN